MGRHCVIFIYNNHFCVQSTTHGTSMIRCNGWRLSLFSLNAFVIITLTSLVWPLMIHHHNFLLNHRLNRLLLLLLLVSAILELGLHVWALIRIDQEGGVIDCLLLRLALMEAHQVAVALMRRLHEVEILLTASFSSEELPFHREHLVRHA